MCHGYIELVLKLHLMKYPRRSNRWSVRKVHDSLSSGNVGKAIGPDMIPNRVLKDFAPELAPLIMHGYL